MAAKPKPAKTTEAKSSGTAIVNREIKSLQAKYNRLQKKIEAYGDLDNYIDPYERYRDGDNFYPPTGIAGTINSRKAGRSFPSLVNEQDLRIFRSLSRTLCDGNYTAIGLRDRVTEFTVGDGFKWEVRLKGTKREQSYSGGAKPAEVVAVQTVLDEWQAINSWTGGPWSADPTDPTDDVSLLQDRETEGFQRLITDGEVGTRFFKGDSNSNYLPLIRWIEPEQIVTPPGESMDGPYSWGFRCDPDDIEKREEIYLQRTDGSNEGEHVPAWQCVFLKSNTPSTVKRGIPDFAPLHGDIERIRKMLSAMGETSAILAQIAYLRQHAPGVTQTQATTMIDGLKDRTATRPRTGGYSTIPERYQEAGTVHDISSGMAYVDPPMLAGTPGFIAVEQALLRGCGARWGMPEFFSGDASNNNFASIAVTGSPFDRATKARQKRYSLFHKAHALKVIAYAVKAGRLTEAEARAVDVDIVCPNVATTDSLKETQRLEILARNKVISAQTWASKEGFDSDKEIANIQAFDELFPDMMNPPADIFGGGLPTMEKP